MIINFDKILNPVVVKDPWTHYIVDDVLNYDFSNELNFIFDDDAYYQMTGELSCYKDKILEKYKPCRLKEKDSVYTSSRVFWQIVQPKEVREIHMDHKDKIWTCVIYCYGSDGTLLLDENKNFHTKVEWKQNRAIIFSPGTYSKDDEVTWHQIENTTNEHRRVITLNITVNNPQMPMRTPSEVWRSRDNSDLKQIYTPRFK